MPVFQQLGKDGKAYFPRNQDAFDLLNGVTADDKARSVPYLKLWRVNPDGTPFDPDKDDPYQPASTVSGLLVEPPRFGSSVDRYPERPAVSMDRVSIKNSFGYGLILWRELTLEFVVHRPEVIFDEGNHEYDQWSAIILPGAMFAMTYGWQGTSANDIMNGNGIVDANNNVEGRKTVLFVVTRYNFKVNTDGSVGLTVFAHENCDNVLNHITLGDASVFDSSNPPGSEGVTNHQGTTREYNTEAGQKVVKRVQDQFDKLAVQDTRDHGRWVKFQDILDGVFAPLFDKALRSVGYADVKMYVGLFNDKVGRAKKEFGGDLTGKSLGDFQVPERFFKDALGLARASGGQMNAYSLFTHLLGRINDQSTWARGLTDSEKEQALEAAGGNEKRVPVEEARLLAARVAPPEVKVKVTSSTKGGKHVAHVYVVDFRREEAAVDFSDRLDPRTTRDKIAEKLKKYGIPLVTFKNGLSFIESGEFSAEQDQQIQAVLISRAVDPSRYEVATQTHAARAADTIDPRKLLYSSSIQGRVTMIGNFVLDSFMATWLEFGVRRWDGVFRVFEKEDTVSRDGFMSSYTFRSQGDDPLNTQGVLKERPSTTPAPVTVRPGDRLV